MTIFIDLLTKYPRWYRHMKASIDNAFFKYRHKITLNFLCL